MPFFVKGEKITLKKDGTWMADGTEITHGQTRDLFFRAIHWDADQKQYYLEVGYERIFIEVEDTPFFVTSITRDAKKGITAQLSNFESVRIKADLLKHENEALYLVLEDGQKAKFLSAPYYDLMRDLKEDGHYYYLVVNGKRANLALLSKKPSV